MKRVLVTTICCLLLFGAYGCSRAEGVTWQEQYDLGVRFLDDGNYAESIIAFSAAIEIDPKNPEAYVGRGNAYVFSGETEEDLASAQEDFEKAIELDEMNVDAWLGLADIHIRRGDYDKALDVLREALEKTEYDQRIADKISEVESGNYIDSSGNLRRMNYYSGSELIYYHVYTYGPDGVMNAVTSYDGVGTQTGHVDLKYNEKGQTLVSYTYVQSYSPMENADDGIVTQLKMEYDDAGNIIREEFYDIDGSLGFYIIDQYDSNGKMTKQIRYDKGGNVFHIDTYEYNTSGEIEKQTSCDPEGSVLSYMLFEYDNEGRITKEACSAPTYTNMMRAGN